MVSVLSATSYPLQVPRQAPEETAALLNSLLVHSDVLVGEANQIITKFRELRADAPVASPPASPLPQPTPAACKPLNNTEAKSTTHQKSPPNWGLDRVDTRQSKNLTNDYVSVLQHELLPYAATLPAAASISEQSCLEPNCCAQCLLSGTDGIEDSSWVQGSFAQAELHKLPRQLQ